ncbi:MAG: hypothetical protein NPIRA03_37720 [Nitrospirales bacterium]|nr:MAG: hypothetical protein NPIRA03_37720 [Nitrospirales bacterium]
MAAHPANSAMAIATRQEITRVEFIWLSGIPMELVISESKRNWDAYRLFDESVWSIPGMVAQLSVADEI